MLSGTVPGAGPKVPGMDTAGAGPRPEAAPGWRAVCRSEGRGSWATHPPWDCWDWWGRFREEKLRPVLSTVQRKLREKVKKSVPWEEGSLRARAQSQELTLQSQAGKLQR